MNKKKALVWTLILVLIGTANFLEAAEPEWIEDFDLICTHTADAGKLSKAELTDLIKKCDELMPMIQVSDSPRKKVYLIRLKKCRNFLDFMRKVAKDEKKTKQQPASD
ncbi:MAG: hypothetical protein LC633_04050 [Desulfobulbaceae bacterium]|nr:hypothetical protein [Desulfobulbaceae bacterium]